MSVPRSSHTATLLPDGRVLIAGSGPEDSQDQTEIYDPASGQFTPGPDMSVARRGQKAVALEDGRVLIISGFSGLFETHDSVDIFDPTTDTISPAAPIATARSAFAVTRLADGRVLVTGGAVPARIASAEIYDPVTDSWASAGEMSVSRVTHTSTLLADGRVLIATSAGLFPNLRAFAEIYDPATGDFTPTGNLNVPRHQHTATLILDGTVLIAGGSSEALGDNLVASVERYDPATGLWTELTAMLRERRFHSASLLADGRVLFVGGLPSEANTERYITSAATGGARSEEVAGVVGATRNGHTVTTLPDGRVLLAGGDSDGTAELFTPSPTRTLPLPPGFNLVGWTGATPVEEALAGLDGSFSGVFTWDPRAERFRSYSPAAPSFVNDLDELRLGEGLWIQVGPGGATWTQPDFAGPRSVALVAGLQLAMWTGPDQTPVASAIEGIAASVAQVLVWDPATQSFRSFNASLPAALNSLSVLNYGDAFWIEVERAVTWDQPAR